MSVLQLRRSRGVAWRFAHGHSAQSQGRPSHPPALSAEDVHKLLTTAPDARTRAVVMALLDTGLRAAEMAKLDGDDIDLRTVSWAHYLVGYQYGLRILRVHRGAPRLRLQ